MGCCGSRSSLTKEEQTILDCKIIRDDIKSYIIRLQRSIDLKQTKAKESLTQKNKDRARMYLLLTKMFSEQIKSAEKELQMIEQKIAALEKTFVRKDSLQVYEEGKKTLKELQKEVDVQKYNETIFEDLKAMKIIQEEVTEFFKKKGLDLEEEERIINIQLDNKMKSEGNDLDRSLPEVVIDPKAKDKAQDNEQKIAVNA